jgi:hypothetical protein
MFSETRYALNGDLRVAYRASAEGPRDIVFVRNWFFCCEVLPECESEEGTPTLGNAGLSSATPHGRR